MSNLTPETEAKIKDLIASNKILVFIKGTKMMPQCGFSNNVVQILNSLGVDYETYDILDDYPVRQGLKEYSNWPTFPQLYVNGELVGGSDIIVELFNSKELHEMLEVALAS